MKRLEPMERLERLLYPRCLGVFAGELRGRHFQPFFLPLQPRLPCPRALEIVADLHMEPAQRLGFKLDQVPILEWVQAAMIGSQRQHVAGLQRVDRADPFDAARDFVRHVAGVVVLHQGPVHP